MRLRFFMIFITAAILLLAAFILMKFAQGYRIAFDGKNLFQKDSFTVASTGLLAATSNPDGASIYINDHLTSATNTTIDLAPGEYTVRIVKEGYLPWEKKLKIQKEVVTQTQALLFPAAPKLESITATGVLNPTPDPTGSTLAFGVASASASRKNGVFIFDMNTRPILTLRSSSLQIADDTQDSLSGGKFSWSPNARELLVEKPKSKIHSTSSEQAVYRLNAGGFNNQPQDVTATIEAIKSQWQKEEEEKARARLDSFKTPLAEFIGQNFAAAFWSTDNTKVLYEASSSADGTKIPAFLDPPLLGASTQKEERSIKKDNWYVYDTKEDKNFFMGVIDRTLPAPVWLPDNRHLVFAKDKQIKIVEYDGTNETVVYSGPFEQNFVYPWPDGSKLVILTSLTPQAGVAPNLYTISLK